MGIRGGSVCVNSFEPFRKWTSHSVGKRRNMKFASQQSHGHFLHRFGFAETGLTTSGSIISWATAGTRSIVTSQRSRTAVWAPEQPVLLHPALSQMYKKKVADLTAVLNDPETKAKATTIIRSMLSEIRLSPIEGALEIELVGELTGLLTLGQKETASKRYASGRSVTLVAGVGFEPTTFRL